MSEELKELRERKKETENRLRKLRYAYDKIMRLENLKNMKEVYRQPRCDTVKSLHEKYKKQTELSDDELWSMIRSSKMNKRIFRYEPAYYRQVIEDFIKYVEVYDGLKSIEEVEKQKIEERKKMKKVKAQDMIKGIDEEISALNLKRKGFEEYKKKGLEDTRKITGQREKAVDMERKMLLRLMDEYRKYENLVKLFSDEKLAEFLSPKIGRLKIDRFRVKEIDNMKYLDEKEFKIFYEAFEKLAENEIENVSKQVKHVDELMNMKTRLKNLFNAIENAQSLRKQRIRCEEEIKKIKDEMDYREKMIDEEEKKLLERKRKLAYTHEWSE